MHTVVGMVGVIGIVSIVGIAHTYILFKINGVALLLLLS